MTGIFLMFFSILGLLAFQARLEKLEQKGAFSRMLCPAQPLKILTRFDKLFRLW